MKITRLWILGLITALIAGFASLSAIAADANMTGTWNIKVESPQGPGTPTFTLKQEGNKLTGTYKGSLGEAPVTGTVTGKEFKITYKIAAQGQELLIDYTGTVEGNSIKGKAKFGDFGDGAFTGTKA